jgi:hypothetical protein
METLQVEQTELLAKVVVGSKVALYHANAGTSVTGEVTEVVTDGEGIKSIQIAGLSHLSTRNRWKDNDFWLVKSLGF